MKTFWQAVLKSCQNPPAWRGIASSCQDLKTEEVDPRVRLRAAPSLWTVLAEPGKPMLAGSIAAKERAGLPAFV